MSSDNDMTEFVELLADHDYEIGTSYPYVIRRKSDGFIPKECVDSSTGYIRVALNKKRYLKHRLIAEQFIANEDPEHQDQVDHINRNRTDYHIENLRWVSGSTNQLNKSSHLGVVYEYVDRLAIDVVSIILYKQWEFEGYFIDQEHNVWFDNGEQYRKLHVDCRNQVFMTDINHVGHKIGVRSLVREFL